MTKNELHERAKTAIVTGGTRGIGAALVRGYVAENFNVAFNYLSSVETAKNLVDELEGKGGRLLAFQADIRDAGEVNELVESTIREFGRVDALVNNAHASYEGKWFEDSSWEDFQWEIDTLLKGPFNTIQAVLPHMKQQGGGAIVNVSSTMALTPRPRHAFYIAAKNALLGLNQALTIELGQYGIRLNVVTPGPLVTDHNATYPAEVMERLGVETPLNNRLGSCEEVADAIIMMTMEKSRFVTGANVLASGGFSVG